MKNKILEHYRILVEYLAKVLGENFEIVLHDLSNIENSIIAIKNGHVSGRKKGDALTDLALKIVNDHKDLEDKYLINYTGHTKDGKELRSSTLFIKNEQKEMIGMLCINIDVSCFSYARDILNQLILGQKEVNKNKGSIPVVSEKKEVNKEEDYAPEKFTNSIEELMHSIINSVMNDTSIPPERMTADEKKKIVQKLDDKGVFLLKNAVKEVADALKSSEATIYRYLNTD
ncbi:helix-turn-helix transcriptional regulator [Sporohalobacter salinus]|uniref:helix-turn-helix transcriptional regulator n=1 Tax=Sporohalobacter salinus TaxID=1494606 RepID=UPI0019601248|nr:PAS domain-containing protein [Sporohalobacter salinus]MBM7624879.1 putative transcriptional regulator YheO [Sporohalobacter salinus]